MAQKEITLVEDLNVRGRLFVGSGKYAEAIDTFERAIEEDPFYTDTYQNLAELYILQKNYPSARDALNKVLQISKDDAEATFHLGNIAYFEGNNEEARTFLTNALEFGFDEARACYHLASLYADLQDYDNSLYYLTKTINAAPYNSAARVHKIEILVSQSKLDEALRNADALIKSRPDTFEGYHYKFSILMLLQREKEALIVLEGAMDQFPDDLGFVYDKIRYLEYQEDFDAAIALMDSKFNPGMESWNEIQKERAKILFTTGRFDDAKAVFEEVLANGYDGEMCHYLMLTQYGHSNFRGCITCAEQIIAAHGNDDVFEGHFFSALYYEAICYRELKEKAVAKEKFERALSAYRWACTTFPGELALYLYRALCYRELKNYDRAFEMIDFIISVSDDAMAEAYIVRSKLYEDIHEPKKAEADKKRAIQMQRTFAQLYV